MLDLDRARRWWPIGAGVDGRLPKGMSVLVIAGLSALSWVILAGIALALWQAL